MPDIYISTTNFQLPRLIFNSCDCMWPNSFICYDKLKSGINQSEAYICVFITKRDFNVMLHFLFIYTFRQKKKKIIKSESTELATCKTLGISSLSRDLLIMHPDGHFFQQTPSISYQISSELFYNCDLSEAWHMQSPCWLKTLSHS